jgi:hypothetical protein
MLLCFCPDSTPNLYPHRKVDVIRPVVFAVTADPAGFHRALVGDTKSRSIHNAKRPLRARDLSVLKDGELVSLAVRVKELTGWTSLRSTPQHDCSFGYATEVIRSGWRGPHSGAGRFLLHVAFANTYHAVYFWKPFPMGNQPGNQPAIGYLSALYAGL